jgi:outer membrane protein TolC
MNNTLLMGKNITLLILIILFSPGVPHAGAQEVKQLTLGEVIRLSELQSPEAMMARHRFRASYWQYRTYVAQYRPSLTLSGTTPDYTTAYTRVYVDGIWEFVPTNMLQNIGSLSLSQNIGSTGGSISLESDLTLQNDFEAETRKYMTVPMSIRLTQPVFRYNSLKWQRRIEPLKYETARKTFIANMENVHLQAVNLFFQLALAQINREIAITNLLNADTLYTIASGGTALAR